MHFVLLFRLFLQEHVMDGSHEDTMDSGTHLPRTNIWDTSVEDELTLHPAIYIYILRYIVSQG